MDEKIIKLELYKREISDLLGILNRHAELLKKEVDSIDDPGEKDMLRFQQRKTENLVKKVSEIYDEKVR